MIREMRRKEKSKGDSNQNKMTHARTKKAKAARLTTRGDRRSSSLCEGQQQRSCREGQEMLSLEEKRGKRLVNMSLLSWSFSHHTKSSRMCASSTCQDGDDDGSEADGGVTASVMSILQKCC